MSELISADHYLADGRRLHCWINEAQASRAPRVAILVPGFGRRMHQHSSVCQYLLANGVSVLRFDSVNHLGLSDGVIADYTLSDGLRSLEAAVDAAHRHFGDGSYALISTSLTSRVALRHFSEDSRISRLIAISGVVNVQRTLAEVHGEDYASWPEPDLPEMVNFEAQIVKLGPWHRDGHQNNWFSLVTTCDEIASLSRPAFWFVGREDSWIEAEDVERCSAASPQGQFRVSWLLDCGHDIGRNASSARTLTRQIVALCRSDEADPEPVQEPNYDQVLQVALQERRLQRAR